MRLSSLLRIPARLRGNAGKIYPAFILIALILAVDLSVLAGGNTFQSAPTGTDAIDYFQPITQLQYNYVQAHHQMPHWFYRAGLGYPSASVAQHGENHWVREIFLRFSSSAGQAANGIVCFYQVSGALVFYALLLVIGLSPMSGFVAAALYPFCDLFLWWTSMYHFSAFLLAFPLSVLGVELTFARKPRLGSALLGLGLGICGLGSHLQVTHLLFHAVGILVILKWILCEGSFRERTRPFLYCALGFLGGALISLPTVVPFLLFQKESTRQGLGWGPIQSIRGLHPWLSLFNSHPDSLDDLNFSMFLGALTPFLALIGFFRALRARRVAAYSLLILVLLDIGVKGVLFKILYYTVPGWKVASNVARVSFVLQLPLLVVTALGLDYLRRLPGRTRLVALFAALGGGLVLWFILSALPQPEWVSVAETLLAVGWIVMLGQPLSKRLQPQIQENLSFGVLAILLFLLARTQMNAKVPVGPDVPAPQYAAWLPLIERNDDPAGRWMSICQDWMRFRPVGFLNSAVGDWLDTYDSFVSRRYFVFWKRLTGSARYSEPLGGQWYFHFEKEPPDRDWMNAAGITRVLAGESCSGAVTKLGWPRLDELNKQTVFKNPPAFPRAYLSHRWRASGGLDQSMVLLQSELPKGFSAHVDVVEGAFSDAPGSGADPLTVKWHREDAENVTIEFPATADPTTLLVWLEAYFQGWEATAEGSYGRSDLKLFPVNAAFMGTFLPSHTVRVRLKYQPFWLEPLAWLSLAAAVALGLLAGCAGIHLLYAEDVPMMRENAR